MGACGEEAAKNYLLQNGFTIRNTNWRWGHKELDIVAVKGQTLHVVEVKTRTVNSLIDPLASVNRQKQRNTLFAANAYMRCFGLNYEVQMDIIVVIVNGNNSEITYIPAAYYPC